MAEDAPPRLGFLASCDHGVVFKCAEDAPPPMLDDDAASGKIDYDFLNQIAKLCGGPAVSGAPRNQIACFLGFFVFFACVLVSKDATQTQNENRSRSSPSAASMSMPM